MSMSNLNSVFAIGPQTVEPSERKTAVPTMARSYHVRFPENGER